MRKIIFGQPICNRFECHYNGRQHGNNCGILQSVEECCLAKIKRPIFLQRAIAWIDDHSLHISLILAVCTLLVFLALCSWLALTSQYNAEIMKLQQADFDRMNKEQSTDAAQRAFKRLWLKHGYPTVIREPGKEPYFIDAKGRKCRFV